MVQRKKRFLALLSPLLLAMCTTLTTPEEPKIPETATLSVTVNGPKMKSDGNYGSGGGLLTHWAVWITDAQGNYVKTLQVNKSTPKLNKYGSDKLSSLPTWQASSGFTTPEDTTGKLTEEKVYKELDAVTAASLNLASGADTTVEVTWDLNDALNTKLVDGVYRIYAEFSALVKNIDSIIAYDTFKKVDAITAATVMDLRIDSIHVDSTTATVYTYTKDSYETHFVAYGLDTNLTIDSIAVAPFPRESVTKIENLIPDTTYYILFRGELLADPENENHAVMGSFTTTLFDTTYDKGHYESQSSFVTVDLSQGTVTDGIVTDNILNASATIVTK